ncbi:MAG: hypothetical protein KY468_18160, partial [Armatimonadetes bacterium]|nr:hypothetical protein [Armatimonadota bacterium]
VEQHGKKRTLVGALVMFPQSPQLRFDVYALQTTDPDGTRLDYTLVNFTDPERFARIRQKLENAWKAHAGTAQSGRNKLIQPRLRVRATGVINIQSPQQANPQILLDGPESIEILAGDVSDDKSMGTRRPPFRAPGNGRRKR